MSKKAAAGQTVNCNSAAEPPHAYHETRLAARPDRPRAAQPKGRACLSYFFPRRMAEYASRKSSKKLAPLPASLISTAENPRSM